MKEKHSNPFSGLAKLLIALGLVLLAARADILGLGSTEDYFTWEVLLILIGLIALLNLDLVFSLLLFATGIYFLMPEMNIQLSPFYMQIYWPIVLILAGIAFMIKPAFKNK